MVMLTVVVIAFVVTGRIVGSVLGDGGAGGADGKHEGHGERRGYACGQFHLCLLMDGFRSWLNAPGRVKSGVRGNRS
jgi:hypothetical protein